LTMLALICSSGRPASLWGQCSLERMSLTNTCDQ
jgi:hypothetical protein